MTLVIALNIIFCAAVIVAVVAPLAWAIRIQARDEPRALAAARRTRSPRRRVGRPAYEAG